MTLKKLLDAISDLAIKEKIINYSEAGADIYALNGKTIKNYPVLFTSPTGSHTVQENSTRYTLTLYYLDRLLNDGENDIAIMSTAIEELKNLINGIKFIDGVIDVEDNWDITSFIETEAMNDKVAGCYATIMIEAVNETTCFVE